jgi:predicted NBD/HSP70 family sugar kinase
VNPELASYRTLLDAGEDDGARPGARVEEPRRSNMTSALACLHLVGPRSRSELVAELGLSRTTVGSLVGDLVAAGVAEEAGVDRLPSPGRPSQLVRLVPERAVVVGVDLGPQRVGVATVGLGGRVFNTVRGSLHGPSREVAGLVQAVGGLVASQLSMLPGTAALVGVGVAVHGLVGDDGTVRHAPNLGWRDVDLRAELAAVLPEGTPVLIDNESTLATVGEYLRGSLRGVDNAVLVTGDVGVGGGAIVNRRLLRGTGGLGGEVGHMVVDPGGRSCGCGAVGCWETTIGLGALLERAALDPDDDEDPVARLRDAFAAPDGAGAAGCEETARWLAIGLANLLHIFNPRRVLVGGALAQLLPAMRPALERELDRRCMPAVRRECALDVPLLGDDAALIGASELAFWSVLTTPDALLAGAGSTTPLAPAAAGTAT